MNARTLAAALAALTAACAGQRTGVREGPAPRPVPQVAAPPAPAPPPAEPPAIRDDDLGLVRGSVFVAAAPPAFVRERSEPGERPVLPRAFPGAPPVVPHALADYTPITRAQSGCLDCHQVPGPKEAGQPTPLPASHYPDLRRAPGTARKTVAGARFVCTACHVTGSDQGPLVQNPAP